MVVIWGIQKGDLDFTNDATNVDEFCVNGNVLDLGVIVACLVWNDCNSYYAPQRPLLIPTRFFTKIFKFFTEHRYQTQNQQVSNIDKTASIKGIEDWY